MRERFSNNSQQLKEENISKKVKQLTENPLLSPVSHLSPRQKKKTTTTTTKKREKKKEGKRKKKTHRIEPVLVQKGSFLVVQRNSPLPPFLVTNILPSGLHASFEEMVVVPRVQRGRGFDVVKQSVLLGEGRKREQREMGKG